MKVVNDASVMNPVMNPETIPSNNLVKRVFSSFGIPKEMYAHSILFVFLGLRTSREHTVRHFRRLCIMVEAKPISVAMLSVVTILSTRVISSTRRAVYAISTGRPVRSSSTTLERPSENVTTRLFYFTG